MFAAWIVWVAIGVLCIIVEIFTPGFLFLSFGFGAIISGLSALVFQKIWLQILFFIISTMIFFITTKKWSSKFLKNSNEPSNIFALEGKKGKVTKKIKEGEKGYVKIGGEIWAAVAEKEIIEGNEIIVKSVEGNKLVVENIKE